MDLPAAVRVLLALGILLTSSGFREGIEQLGAQTLNVLYVSSCQGQIVHPGRGRQQTVNHGDVADVVHSAPSLGNVGVNRQNPAFVILFQVSQPIFENFSLPWVAISN